MFPPLGGAEEERFHHGGRDLSTRRSRGDLGNDRRPGDSVAARVARRLPDRSRHSGLRRQPSFARLSKRAMSTGYRRGAGVADLPCLGTPSQSGLRWAASNGRMSGKGPGMRTGRWGPVIAAAVWASGAGPALRTGSHQAAMLPLKRPIVEPVLPWFAVAGRAR
jgi:hypothetical protein